MRLQIKSFSPQAGSFNKAEVTIIKARGNFQPLTTHLELYRHHSQHTA
jgi:hypothetical protein